MSLLVFFSTMKWRLGLAWVRGVYGAVERRHAAPAVVGRLGLVLDTELGFCRTRRRRRRTDGRTKLTRSTQQANHHRGPQRKGGWGGRSEVFTCGVGEGRGAPLRLRPRALSFELVLIET